MTPADIHSLAGPYALHALPTDEEADFEAHLATCDECRREVASFEATTVRLAELADEAPPPDMKANVMAMIATVRQDPPAGVVDEPVHEPVATPNPATAAPTAAAAPVAPATTTSTSRITALAGRLGLGMAAGLLVVAGALGVWATGLNSQLQERDQAAQQVAAVLSADGARTVQADGATLVVNPADNQAVLAIGTLGQAPSDDQVLQMWVIDADGPTSAGLVDDPTQPVLLDQPVRPGQVVGVTVEPAGGSEQPTSDPIWVGEI